MSGSGISWPVFKSAPRSRQITMPAPQHSVFTGRMPFLQPNEQRQSTDEYMIIDNSDDDDDDCCWMIGTSTNIMYASISCLACFQKLPQADIIYCTKPYKYQLSLIDRRDRAVLLTELDDLCYKLQWSSVGARRHCQLS